MDALSFWWFLAAFLGGGCAGMLVMALMSMAGGLPKQSHHVASLNEQPW